MELMSFLQTLSLPHVIIAKGECRDEFLKYVRHLCLLLRNKLQEGSFLQASRVISQIRQALINTPYIKVVAGEALEAELEFCCIELYVKQKSKTKQQQHIAKLKQILNRLRQGEKDYFVYKTNCLILFDQDFLPLESQLTHPDLQAIKHYALGNYKEAATLLEDSLKLNFMPDFNLMRRVWIGRILIQREDLSGFAWLNYIIQATLICPIEKYEARILFICGYKALIVCKERNPQLATVPLDSILDGCCGHLENTANADQTSFHLVKLEKCKLQIKGTIDNRIKYIEMALQQIVILTCYPDVSIEELDLRIQLAQLLYQKEEYNRCLDETEKSKTLASQLDIYNWWRQLKLAKLSALMYMRLGYYESVIEILERVMKIEPDRVERLKCLQWKIEAQRQRTEDSMSINQRSEGSFNSPVNIGVPFSLKSIKSSKSNQASSPCKSLLTKNQSGLGEKQPANLNINSELNKIKKSNKSYHYRFKNRRELRDSIRSSYEAEPKCCLMF